MTTMASLPERIQAALNYADIAWSAAAIEIGLSAQAASKWKKGQIGKETLKKLAGLTRVNAGWLLNGEGDMLLSQSQDRPQNMNYRPPVDIDDNPPTRLTPVISWVQAGDFTAVVSADLSHAIEWIPYSARAGKHGFALIVKGASMEPEFKAGEYVYINPTFQIDELNTGALVVMACDGDSEATFKELVSEGGKYYLRALNPDWHEKIMPIDHTCRLVGKVVGKYVNY